MTGIDTEELADVIVTAIKTAIAPRDAKIQALEQRLTDQAARILELEARAATVTGV